MHDKKVSIHIAGIIGKDYMRIVEDNHDGRLEKRHEANKFKDGEIDRMRNKLGGNVENHSFLLLDLNRQLLVKHKKKGASSDNYLSESEDDEGADCGSSSGSILSPMIAVAAAVALCSLWQLLG